MTETNGKSWKSVQFTIGDALKILPFLIAAGAFYMKMDRSAATGEATQAQVVKVAQTQVVLAREVLKVKQYLPELARQINKQEGRQDRQIAALQRKSRVQVSFRKSRSVAVYGSRSDEDDDENGWELGPSGWERTD